jgi:hypothetical protein
VFSHCRNISNFQVLHLSVTVVLRLKVKNIFVLYNTGIMGSNSTRDMEVCANFAMFMLMCAGNELATADYRSKESYRLPVRFIVSELFRKGNRPKCLIRQMTETFNSWFSCMWEKGGVKKCCYSDPVIFIWTYMIIKTQIDIVTDLHYAGHPIPRSYVTGVTAVTT